MVFITKWSSLCTIALLTSTYAWAGSIPEYIHLVQCLKMLLTIKNQLITIPIFPDQAITPELCQLWR